LAGESVIDRLAPCRKRPRNRRVLFEEVAGYPPNGRPDITEVRWGLGAIGMAVCSKVRWADQFQAKPAEIRHFPCGQLDTVRAPAMPDRM